MRQRIYGLFNNIEDARNALGRIKKESWRRADLSIILPADSERPQENSMEFAADFSEKRPGSPWSDWPGLQQEYWEEVGNVRVGSTLGDASNPTPSIRENLAGKALQFVQRGIRDSKVVTIIDFEPELLYKLRFILESKGAELQADQA